MPTVHLLPRHAREILVVMLLIAFVVVASGCGGGGSSSNAPPPSSATVEGVATPTSVAVVTATNAQ